MAETRGGRGLGLSVTIRDVDLPEIGVNPDQPQKIAKLFGSGRYLPVLFFCHLSLEKALKALYVEKFNDIPEKTHSLILLVELIELELPDNLIDSLLVINRLGVTGRYPHNLDKMLEQYTGAQTKKILAMTTEILTWLMQKSSKR